ncbi:MAG: C40 family peptidase [Flavobacteriaceae bacterium]|nr:C40 family peptidase [Flavobacteriaceae bacterium]
MLFGICNLSIVPVRLEPNENYGMISQVLFGEHFKVLERRKEWSKIRMDFDKLEGWIDNKQYLEIDEDYYIKLTETPRCFAGEYIDFITDKDESLATVPLGACLPFYSKGKFEILDSKYTYDGATYNAVFKKETLIKIAFMFLNAPFLKGGKTPFGIDSGGFTQTVYKLCGHQIFRTAPEQAKQGEVLSFIEESEPGDLALFDDAEGNIVHVGLIMFDNYIIHSFGKVRIDRLDHSGIFNEETGRHTHKLRVIKKII